MDGKSPEGSELTREEYAVMAQTPAGNETILDKYFNAREKAVLERRLGLNGEPLSLEATGRELKVTRERVRLWQKKAQEKLLKIHQRRALRDSIDTNQT